MILVSIYGDKVVIDNFPLTLAQGEAFINRENERKKLGKLMMGGKHVWLQAHRRHGKSSLLLQTCSDLNNDKENVVYHREDLSFSGSSEEVIRKLCHGSSTLIIKILDKALNLDGHPWSQRYGVYFERAAGLFQKFAPAIKIERGMPTISFGSKHSTELLTANLQKLDELASEHGIRSIFMIDEFQVVGKVDNGYHIEGEIRHCMELAKSTTFIFCGSERSLMEQALASKGRPLYKHTYHFPLERISREKYQHNFSQLWLTQWDEPLGEELFDRIMGYTERHPYYVNYLMSELWLLDTEPDSDAISVAWDKIVDEELDQNKSLILKLKNNELKILRALADRPESKVRSSEFSRRSNVPDGSIQRTLDMLLDKDIIYLNEQQHTVINPALAALARR